MSFFADNLLKNPGAESGTSHWSGSPSVVEGGIEVDDEAEPRHCFEIPEGGSMYQTVNPPEGSFSGTIRISASYLPEYMPERKTDRQSYHKIQAIVNHSTGGRTTHTCPCEIAETDTGA